MEKNPQTCGPHRSTPTRSPAYSGLVASGNGRIFADHWKISRTQISHCNPNLRSARSGSGAGGREQGHGCDVAGGQCTRRPAGRGEMKAAQGSPGAEVLITAQAEEYLRANYRAAFDAAVQGSGIDRHVL